MIGQNQASESQLDRGAGESKVNLAHGVNLKPSRAPTNELSFGDAGSHVGATRSWMSPSPSAAATNLAPI